MRYIKRGSLTPHPMTFGVQPALWLDTSDINERILNSGNVSSGLDKSSYNEDYDQPTAANQPFLNVGAQNGLDTWRGDGINDYLINSAGVSLGTNNTLFLVCEPNSITQSYIISGNAPSASPAILSQYDPGTGIEAFEYWFWGTRASFATSATGIHVLAVTQDDGASPSTRGYYDGNQVFTGNFSSWAPYTFNRLMNDNLLVSPYNGNFCEGIVYNNKTFTSREINIFSNQYFKNKWAIP